jgi:hypothetical protein
MSVPIDPDDFFRAWTTDAQGNRVLVGLNADETAEYLAYREDCLKNREDTRQRGRWIDLLDKHELARIAVISAENELRVQKPVRN